MPIEDQVIIPALENGAFYLISAECEACFSPNLMISQELMVKITPKPTNSIGIWPQRTETQQMNLHWAAGFSTSKSALRALSLP